LIHDDGLQQIACLMQRNQHRQGLLASRRTVLQKVGIRKFSSFRRKPESREFKQLQFPWTLVFTGVTTFCVIVMKELDLREQHRIVGVVIAPLLILQVLSGIFLCVDWLLGIHRRAGEVIKETFSPLVRLWDI